MVVGSKPVEILMTESGDIPLPDGITDETDIEVWAWGGGGGGVKGGGGGGGQCVHVNMKGSDLGKLKQLTLVVVVKATTVTFYAMVVGLLLREFLQRKEDIPSL